MEEYATLDGALAEVQGEADLRRAEVVDLEQDLVRKVLLRPPDGPADAGDHQPVLVTCPHPASAASRNGVGGRGQTRGVD